MLTWAIDPWEHGHPPVPKGIYPRVYGHPPVPKGIYPREPGGGEGTTFQLPFAVFLMRNAFDGVSRELDEAALIGGCDPITALRWVMLPLVLPAFVTAGLTAFLGSWNEFLVALVFMGDSERYTLPVFLMNLRMHPGPPQLR